MNENTRSTPRRLILEVIHDLEQQFGSLARGACLKLLQADELLKRSARAKARVPVVLEEIAQDRLRAIQRNLWIPAKTEFKEDLACCRAAAKKIGARVETI
ncbi:MAG: hypothetical protein ACR2JB_05345 [Bryobacteraceae bacterium]